MGFGKACLVSLVQYIISSSFGHLFFVFGGAIMGMMAGVHRDQSGQPQ